MKALILGCGPAGLFAAHAATQCGFEVHIASKKRRSEMFGAQYLHATIPGITDAAQRFEVNYKLVGSPEDYAVKVYGDNRPDFVSPAALTGRSDAWDIRSAYHRAWDLYSWNITDAANIDSTILPRLIELVGADVTISTIPAPAICYQRDIHTFTYREAWAIGDAPERGVFAPFHVEPNTVVCNGDAETGWYRAATINGYSSVEWPDERKPPVEGVAKIQKVIRTNCNCYLELQSGGKFLRVGRYGAWDKSALTHDAYWDTLKQVRLVAS